MWKDKKRKTQFAFNAEKVFLAAAQPLDAVFSYFQTTPAGISVEEVEERQSLYGKNEVEHERRKIRFLPSSRRLLIRLSVF